MGEAIHTKDARAGGAGGRAGMPELRLGARFAVGPWSRPVPALRHGGRTLLRGGAAGRRNRSSRTAGPAQDKVLAGDAVGNRRAGAAIDQGSQLVGEPGNEARVARQIGIEYLG